MHRKYGWIKEKADERDIRYSIAKPINGLPAASDLRGQLPDCWDQEQTSSCTAHGIGAALWSGQVVAGQPPVMPSRLFLYWNERQLEGDTDQDGGAIIRDGIRVCNQFGIVSEKLWPFNEFRLFVKPSENIYTKAMRNRIHFYAAVDLTNLDQIRLALSHKLPIVFGFDVYDYFESAAMAKKGILNMPAHKEQFLGGHCVAIVGHDDAERMFLVRNSWGTEWGPFNGYFKMSYDYVTSNMCSDGWVIRLK